MLYTRWRLCGNTFQTPTPRMQHITKTPGFTTGAHDYLWMKCSQERPPKCYRSGGDQDKPATQPNALPTSADEPSGYCRPGPPSIGPPPQLLSSQLRQTQLSLTRPVRPPPLQYSFFLSSLLVSVAWGSSKGVGQTWHDPAL